MYARLLMSFLVYYNQLILFFIFVLQVGNVRNHQDKNLYDNESVNEGDEWSMEVDLRSGEKEKRTLHWFVRGKQQKGFIKGVPDRVEFGVCYCILLLHFLAFSVHDLGLSVQVFMYWQHNRVDFLRLEKANLPMAVSGLEGESGIEW